MSVPETAEIYEKFFNKLLTSSNSIPIQSLWLVAFTPPAGSGNWPKAWIKGVDDNEGGWEIKNGYNIASNTGNLDGAIGALFAQAVNIPGDSLEYERAGTGIEGNTRFAKGLIGSGRSEFTNLSISFLETDTSFSEYIIRPWLLNVNYYGLKRRATKENRADINIYHFAKDGANKPLRLRKGYLFKAAAPINVDTEEYNYGGDEVKQRQVEFVYDRYILLDSREAATESLIEKLGLRRLFDQVSPGNLIDRATEFAEDLIVGTGTRVITHVGGEVADGIERLIQRGESAAREFVNDGVSSLNDAVTDGIDRLTGFEENDDSPTFDRGASFERAVQGSTDFVERFVPSNDNPVADDFQEVVADTEDRLRQVREIRDRNPLSDEPGPHFGTIKIPEDDMPRFSDPRAEQTKGGQGTLANGDDANSDTPFFRKQIPNDVTASEPLEDTPRGIDLTSDFNKVNQDDITRNVLAEVSQKIPSNDEANSRDINPQIFNVPEDDESVGKNVKFQQVNINADDFAARETIKSQQVNIPANDFTDEGQVPFQKVNVPEQEANISEGVKSQIKDTPIQDIPVPGSIPVQLVSIDENDTRGSLTTQPVKIPTDDSINRTKPEKKRPRGIEEVDGDTPRF
jgi:hypothetical protein